MLTIKLDTKDLARVETRLYGIRNGVPTALMRALNKTLTGARTDASAIMRDEVTAKKRDLDTHIKPQKATVADLTASVLFDHQPIALSKYETKTDPLGMHSRIWKKKGFTFHPHAFQAGMKSGRQGVFRRRYHKGEGPGTYKVAVLGRKLPWAKMPKLYRFPIKQLWGPTVKNLMADIETPMLPRVADLASERLRVNMERETNYLVNK